MKKNRKKIVMPKVSPIQYPRNGRGIIRKAILWFKYTRRWEVIEDWYYTLPDGTKIVIPKGFTMDGASVPRPLRSHDHMVGVRYGEAGDEERYKFKDGAGKVYWDKLFLDVANAANGLLLINKVAYSMLTAFGFIAWNNHRGRLPAVFFVD
jgi:hypothetical protein